MPIKRVWNYTRVHSTYSQTGWLVIKGSKNIWIFVIIVVKVKSVNQTVIKKLTHRKNAHNQKNVHHRQTFVKPINKNLVVDLNILQKSVDVDEYDTSGICVF